MSSDFSFTIFAALLLKLIVKTSEYLDIFDVTEGIRLVVHNQTTMPVRETQGINIPTGFDTWVVIKRVGTDSFLFYQVIGLFWLGHFCSFKIENCHYLKIS